MGLNRTQSKYAWAVCGGAGPDVRDGIDDIATGSDSGISCYEVRSKAGGNCKTLVHYLG